jgi:hypothetical protein
VTDHRQSPNADVADAALPDVLETLLQAEADFARLLREAAPLPEGSTKDSEYLELVTRYDRYVPSAEVTAIARLLYTLDAYGATDAKAIDQLIALHNERIAELASDTAYLHRMRIPKSRLLEAQFSGHARHNAVSNFKVQGRVAIDATTMGRLLVEFANKNQVDEAMRLLAALGFFAKADGNYNSKIYLSTGKLEALYRGYLAQVARGVGEALGRSRAVRKRRGRGQ